MSIAKAVARAWHDAAYKARLLRDPHAALREEGVSLPEGSTVKVWRTTIMFITSCCPRLRPTRAG